MYFLFVEQNYIYLGNTSATVNPLSTAFFGLNCNLMKAPLGEISTTPKDAWLKSGYLQTLAWEDCAVTTGFLPRYFAY